MYLRPRNALQKRRLQPQWPIERESLTLSVAWWRRSRRAGQKRDDRAQRNVPGPQKWERSNESVESRPAPQNIPVRTPGAVAGGNRKHSKKSPSKLPSVIAAMVSPASSIGPHPSVPSAASTIPQSSVIQRDRRRKRAGSWSSAEPPRRLWKSITLEAASEFSEPLALDIATAKIAAISRPRTPGGMAVTMKSGKTES